MTRGWFFLFFVVSGFCSLLYQVVWLRLSIAAFGVTAPMVSIVLSVFMAGLALGSWAAGRLAGAAATPALPVRLYAVAELVIALSGEAVPRGLAMGRSVLSGTGADIPWGSSGYYLASGACVAAVMLPFCACMGATVPLAMWAVRGLHAEGSARSFSYLYLANVVGALLGTLVSAFVLIELFGFRGTARVAATLNALLACGALALSLRASTGAPPAAEAAAPDGLRPTPRPLALLFASGFTSMGMEVVWVRQFTPYLGTVVYTFALIVACYLAATFAGSSLYRALASRGRAEAAASAVWPVLGLLALLSLPAADPRLPLAPGVGPGLWRLALGVVPLCAALGFLTPLVVDGVSGGEARRAGGAYAVNVLGCIAGPLAAGFALLPHLGERWATVALALPLFACAVGVRTRWSVLAPAAAAGLGLAMAARDFSARFERAETRSDHAATVIVTGEGMDKNLLVNGIGMTRLTPITKAMVHLPLASLDAPPRSGLVVCFGMGTSFRSLMSWDVQATAVELVPSVPEMFGFFHPDGPALLRAPRARVVVDDGRRFLERTRDEFDVITIDPPPPVEAAGSSLLYSREFYELAALRLRPGGILAQWLPQGDGVVVASFTRALLARFAEVRAFPSVEGGGIQFLASDRPFPRRSAAALAARLPRRAADDLVEWGPFATPEAQFQRMIGAEMPVTGLVGMAPGVPALSDDHPFNEYFLIRRMLRPRRRAQAPRPAPAAVASSPTSASRATPETAKPQATPGGR